MENEIKNKLKLKERHRIVPFEREAFAHQHDLLYNSTRKRFVMWRKPDAKP